MSTATHTNGHVAATDSPSEVAPRHAVFLINGAYVRMDLWSRREWGQIPAERHDSDGLRWFTDGTPFKVAAADQAEVDAYVRQVELNRPDWWEPPSHGVDTGVSVFLHNSHYPSPGSRHVSFRVLTHKGLDAIHEGRNLTLDEVLAQESFGSEPLEGRRDPDAPEGYDAVVFDGKRAVARLEYFGPHTEQCRLTRFNRPEADDDDEPVSRDQFEDLITHPPKPGCRRAPYRAFRVFQQGRFWSQHEGRGLTIEEVIAMELAWREPDPIGEPDRAPLDLAVFDGDRIAAVIHAFIGPGQTSRVTRFEGWEGDAP